MKSLKDQSRVSWHNESGQIRCSNEDIQTGAMQRIADAMELMTSDYGTMKRDLEMYKQACKDKNETIAHLWRRISALQGVITKLKKKAQ
jgi:hypothetical protein